MLEFATDMKIFFLLSTFFFYTLSLGYAADSDSVIISCEDPTLPASQLIYKGKELSENEAKDLKELGEDISLLDPKPSDVWYPSYAPRLPVEANPPVAFPNEGAILNFEKEYDNSRNFYIGVASSESSRYHVTLSLTSIDTLLMHALLEKLEYRTEPLKWYKNLTLQFKSIDQINDFKKAVADKNDIGAAKPEDNAKIWIVNEDLKNLKLTLKDVILESPEIKDTRYSWGEVTPSSIGKNRATRSLIVLYSLLNLNSRQRSLNLFSWSAAKKINEGILFEHPVASRFQGLVDCDDVKWITRKISKLTEKDWNDLANIAPFKNRELNQLLNYKFISRRNSLSDVTDEVFGDEDAFTPRLPFNRRFTSQSTFTPENSNKVLPIIQKGKITDGFKSDENTVMSMSVGELKSPLEWDQIKHLIPNEIINAALSEFTSYAMKNTMIGDPAKQQLSDALQYQTEESQRLVDYVYANGSQDGFAFKIKPWAAQYGNFLIQFNREVTTGSYYGSSAKAQLVDTVAIGLAANNVSGVFGKASLTPYTGTAAVTYTHVFTHVRPLPELKAIKDEKRFKNAFEPKVFNHIRDLLNFKTGKSETSDTDVEKALTDFLDTFKEGEVLTLSNALGGKIGLATTFNIANILGPWALAVNPSLSVSVSHENTFTHQITFNRTGRTLQIYDSSLRPSKDTLQLGLGIYPKFLKKGLTVATGSLSKKRGRMSTDVIAIDLSAYLPDSASVINSTADEKRDLLTKLKDVFSKRNVDHLKADNVLIPLKHQLKGNAANFAFLGLVRGRYKENHKVVFVSPINPKYPNVSEKDRTTSLYSSRIVHVNGKDPYGLFGKVTDSLLNVSIGPTSENPNPSGTFFGKSHLNGVQVDADITQRTQNEFLSLDDNQSFLRVGFLNESYSGTIMSGKNLRKLMSQFEEKYKYLIPAKAFYSEADFANVTNNQTYDIRSKTILYTDAIRKIENLFDSKRSEIERKNELQTFSDSTVDPLSEDYSWLDEAIALSRRMTRSKIGQWFANIFDLFQRRALNDLERDQMHHVEWLTRILELLNKKSDPGKLLGYLGKDKFNMLILINGKRIGTEDGNEGVILNPGGTQVPNRLPFKDVSFQFNSNGKDPVKFEIGGNVFEPSPFFGGF